MADRADFLARTLLGRLAALETNPAGDGRSTAERAARLATIEKVLAVEVGVTDGATHALIEAAAPAGRALRRGDAREVVEFAAFLRRRLADALAGGAEH